MKRLLALAAWIFLSVYLIAAAHAGTEGQGTPTTPEAAVAWQEKEKARSETKKRAEALREEQIKKEEANQVPPESLVPPPVAK